MRGMGTIARVGALVAALGIGGCLAEMQADIDAAEALFADSPPDVGDGGRLCTAEEQAASGCDGVCAVVGNVFNCSR